MINRFKWLEVKPETRRNIAVFLNIRPTGGIEVVNNQVVCDGFTDKDLCTITPELLKESLGEGTLKSLGVSTTDVYEMFYELVRRMELPVTVFQEEPVVKETIKKIVKKVKK